MFRIVTLIVIALAASVFGSDARAQDRPITSVLTTETTEAANAGLAAAVDRTIRGELADLDAVTLSTAPALELEELQFAVGCVGVTDECLTQIAGQLEAQALLLSTVERAGETVVLDVSFFEVSERATERATRRVSGADAESEVLDEVAGALREVLGLPPPPERAPEPEETPEPEPEQPPAGEDTDAESPPAEQSEEPVDRDPAPAASGGGGLPVAPIVVGGLGVAAIGVGVVFGVMSNGAESDFQNAPVGTAAEIDAAYERLDEAETQAIVADVLFAVGGALVITSAVLFLVMGGEDDDSAEVAIAPFAGPNGAGLTAAGTFGGAL